MVFIVVIIIAQTQGLIMGGLERVIGVGGDRTGVKTSDEGSLLGYS